LLTVIFCSELGYYFFYSLQYIQLKQQVEKELMANLPVDKLVIIELDKNIHRINWEEAGREFYLDGQLYDVQKKVIKKGKTILYCLNDIKEEQLLKEMGNAAHHGNDKQQNKFSFKIANDYCLIENTEKISAPSKELPQYFFHFNETDLPAAKEIIVPPPRS